MDSVRHSGLARRGAHVFAALAAASALIALGALPAFADDLGPENFESFPAASPLGVGGWTAQDIGGYNAAGFDIQVQDPSAVWGTALGTRALRISNAVTSDAFGNQLQSPSLVNEAGEAGALNNGLSGGTRQSRMTGAFDVASATQAYQAGMSVTVSLDRGDGARQTWLRVFDEAGGMTVQVATFESATNSFVYYTVASGLSFTEVHHIDFSLDMVDGANNDVFTVRAGGQCGSWATSGSWEDFHRYYGGPVTVDSLLWRVSGAAAPALAGGGYFIDNVALGTATTAPMPALGVPGAPTTPTGHIAIGGVTTVTVPAVTTNLCAPVTGYTVTVTPTDGSDPVTFSSATGSFSFPTPFNGAFTVTVSATNSQGTGAPSPLGQLTFDPVFSGDDELAFTGDNTGVLSGLAAALTLAGVAGVIASRRARGGQPSPSLR